MLAASKKEKKTSMCDDFFRLKRQKRKLNNFLNCFNRAADGAALLPDLFLSVYSLRLSSEDGSLLHSLADFGSKHQLFFLHLSTVIFVNL